MKLNLRVVATEATRTGVQVIAQDYGSYGTEVNSITFVVKNVQDAPRVGENLEVEITLIRLDPGDLQ